ncbi:MAG: hypothetical protein IT577_23345 [Verrucomicrobiae bacterium]|nr:hypothetical protein [Verrucomicrobiae bacterium]
MRLANHDASVPEPTEAWERTEAELRARRIADLRRVASGEVTAAEINAANYAWPDPATCRTIDGPRDLGCLELGLD